MIMTKQRWKLAGLTTAFLSLITLSAESAQAITFSTGDFSGVTGGDDVTEGANESNTQIFFIDEGQTSIGSSGVSVDASTSDVGETLDTSNPGTLGSISNERVKSFIFSFDPSGNPTSKVEIGDDSSVGDNDDTSFQVTFDREILGLIYTDDNLNDSDSTLGRTSATYPTNDGSRGLEISADDVITWVDTNTLRFESVFVERDKLDQIRVVQAVPFEAEGTMGLLALGGYFGYRYLKKRKQASLENEE